jgi:hypothetical protein
MQKSCSCVVFIAIELKAEPSGAVSAVQTTELLMRFVPAFFIGVINVHPSTRLLMLTQGLLVLGNRFRVECLGA